MLEEVFAFIERLGFNGEMTRVTVEVIGLAASFCGVLASIYGVACGVWKGSRHMIAKLKGKRSPLLQNAFSNLDGDVVILSGNGKDCTQIIQCSNLTVRLKDATVAAATYQEGEGEIDILPLFSAGDKAKFVNHVHATVTRVLLENIVSRSDKAALALAKVKNELPVVDPPRLVPSTNQTLPRHLSNK